MMPKQTNTNVSILCPVAFIGLGVMGFPMAGHLATAGHSVTVFNRTKSKADDWAKQFNGRVASSPADAVEGAKFVFSCVADDAALEAVCLGEGGTLSAISQGAIHVDHTTTSAEISRRMAQEASVRGAQFLDAPVSGGQMGAQKGTLSIMIGGNSNAYESIKPVIDCFGKSLFYMGGIGSGQTAKMVNQILIGGIMQSLAEALNFGMRMELDMPHLIEVLAQGTGRSWQMEQRALNMVNGKFDYGFAVDLLHKDLQLCLEEAERSHAPLPLTQLVDSFLDDLRTKGIGNLDHSSLITRFS